MPTYDYHCRFSDEPLRECPQCGGEVRRVIHAVGVIFKGSGFYCTDSRKGPKAEPEAASTSTESKDATAGSTKSGKETVGASKDV